MARFLSIAIALALLPFELAQADPPGVQIEEVMSGANGDSRIQFIEIKMQSPGDNQWGPQSGETAGRLRLVFFDATGAQTGEYVFGSDPAIGPPEPIHGGYSVLVATQQFAQLPGMPSPDFIIPVKILSEDGKVCITSNPANPNAPAINLCLSYGQFIGDTGTDVLGQPAGNATVSLPAVNASTLQRNQNFGNYGTGQYNADFALLPASPRNSAGDVGTITVASASAQGHNLFMFETFNGNGRTCATCHQPDIGFGLNPTKISFMNPTDPLFVAENDPVLDDLENTCLLHGSRGLNLENIDGFNNPPVFRGSPNLINLAFTAPYGRSGNVPDLQTFANGAVLQHFPKTLARNSNPNLGPLDFRLPTAIEKADMEAFMLSIQLPANGNFDIDTMINAAISRGADGDAINRGRQLFTGAVGSAKCFLCHSGPVLASVDPILGTGNQSFNTGVSTLFINSGFQDACLGGQPLPQEDGGNRTFSTPQLIGVANTAPYFHNNAVQTLREAVAFYGGTEFNASPAAQNQNIGEISLTEPEINDITAFLTALEEPFIDCNNDSSDDRVQLVSGFADCNGNNVLDVCELAGDDCNNNGIPDECDFTPLKVDTAFTEPTAFGGFFATTADIDNDGDPDLIIPGWTAVNLQVYLNNGNGRSFTNAGAFPVSSNPRGAAVADFDGDGYLDVAVPNLLANHVSLLLNNGVDGQHNWLGFAAAVQIPMNYGGGPPAGSIFVLAHDMNNDGRADLVVCKYFMNEVSIALNLGGVGGSWLGFGTPVDYSTGGITSNPWSVAAGRLNNDLYADLVVADRGTNQMRVFLSDGNGGFLAPIDVATEDAPESVAVGDLNHDGHDDVAVANVDSDTLSVYMNDGLGGLGTPHIIPVGSYPFGAQPHSVVMADMDKDGDLDLVCANKESRNISALINDGAGNFGPLINVPLATGPDYAAVADLDGDGKLDIVTAHFSDAISSILINHTPPFGGDCNGNGIPDDCDVASGLWADVNGNNVPDACEHIGDFNFDNLVTLEDVDGFVAVLLGLDTEPMHVNSADIDGNGVPNGLDIPPFIALMSAN